MELWYRIGSAAFRPLLGQRCGVADVGCGHGASTIFEGYPGTGYDLVTFFDCLHDMGDPGPEPVATARP